MDNSSNGKSVGANIAGAKDGWRYRLGVAHENGDNLRTPVGDVPYTEFSSLSVNGFTYTFPKHSLTILKLKLE